MTKEHAVGIIRGGFDTREPCQQDGTYQIAAVEVHRTRGGTRYYVWLVSNTVEGFGTHVWNCTSLVAKALGLTFDSKWGATQASEAWVLQHQVKELARVLGIPLRLEVM
jgi:hypothetical protein